MKKRIREFLNVSLPIYIGCNILYILLGSYFVFNQIIKYSSFSYGFIALLCINILLVIILFFKKKYIKNEIDIFLLLIIIFAIISTIFAYNPNKALFGAWGRYEGLFSICYYITILFLTSFLKKEDRKIILFFILMFGFIQFIYACAQKFNLFNIHTRIKDGYRWATGFTGNRNFFGTIMVICIGYSIGLYMESSNKVNMLLYLILTFLFSIGILFSKTRSCFVGLIFMMIVLLIYVIKNKYIKKYIVLVFVLVSSIFLLQILNFEPMSRFTNTIDKQNSSNENLYNRFSSNRIQLWKETIKIAPKYLLHGVGLDNFANISEGNPIRIGKSKFDKAHNEFLQILVTMGIFSLISYLFMYYIIIKNGIKNTFKTHEFYLILPVIGYLVQAQFNISVIGVAPLFYIALGLLIDRRRKI